MLNSIKNVPAAGRVWSRPALALIVLLLVALAMAGCRQDDPAPEAAGNAAMHRANPARTGVYPTEGPAAYESIKWQFDAADWIFGAPAVWDDAVFFTSYDGNAYAVDRETGAERWRFESGAEIIASAAVADGLVYVGNMGGLIIALESATGAEQWRVEAETGFIGSPAVVDGAVYFTGENGLLLALDAATGVERWRFQMPNTAISYSAAVAGGLVYVAVSDGILYALDSGTGASWRTNQATSRS